MAVLEPVEEHPSSEEFHLAEKDIERLRTLCRRSLFFLCRAVLGFKDLTQHIHGPVCEDLEDMTIKRKIIVIPRTWFKSSIGSIGFPIWLAINNPNVRVLICQNSHSNACKKLGSIRKIFEKNTLFRLLFPELLPTSECKWKDDVLEVNRTATHPEGTFEAAGTGTATTSRHFDVIIEDDTVSPEKDSMGIEMQQPTALEIEKAIGWHKLTMPLLVNPSEGIIVIIGTRWAEEDLIGYVMANFPEYHVITRAVREFNGVPAVKEEGGTPAWPERFTEEVLEEIERVLGPYMFATLMMNHPTSAANMVFRRDWIRYFDSIDIVKLITCTTIDPAASKKETTGNPDYTVILTSGVDPKSGQIYVLDYTRERLNPGETIETLFTHYALYHPVEVRVESTAYQATLQYWIEQKQRKASLFFPVEPVPHARVSKDDRIRGLQPFFSNLLVHMRNHMDVLERELLAFPSLAGHDDCIDALSMQIPFWNATLSLAREQHTKELLTNPFSGDSIIQSILGRAQEQSGYPWDIGHMRHRHEAPYYGRRLAI